MYQKVECISAMLYECGAGETSSPFGDPSCRGSRTVQRTPCICSSIRCCSELNFLSPVKVYYPGTRASRIHFERTSTQTQQLECL